MSDRPSDDGGSVRSDAASRLAALLADVVDDPTPSAPSPRPSSNGGAAPRRVLRRRDRVEPAHDPDPGGADDDVDVDPEATQPIEILPAPPAAADADDERAREADEEVLAQARAVRPRPAPRSTPAVPLRKEPGGEWSRPVPPVAADPSPETSPEPPPAGPEPKPKSKPEPAPAPSVASAPDAEDDGPAGARVPRLTVRAVAFGLALALLMGAVPVLGWVGSQRLLDSRGGDIQEGGGQDITEPGYRALVTPTQTALVVHRDAEGTPVSAAILALGAGDAGGTVLLVPMGLQPSDTTYFKTILAGYQRVGDDDGFRRSIEDVIGISVPPPVIDVTDESLATLVAPVAPLPLSVTDPVTTEDGTPYQGQVSLAAEEVGPYLRATREGEPEIAHLERIRDLWVAWLDAIGTATSTEPIGAAATGMGSFLRVLSEGDPVVETLDVEEEVDYFAGATYVPAEGMDEQIIAAVPFPVSPRAGRRFDIQLLNGVVGEALPMGLMRELMLAGGSLSSVGNAGEFGQERTVVLYDPEWKDEAEAVGALLGDAVELEPMTERRAEAEDRDMIITVGSDVLSRYQEEEAGGG